MWRKLGSVLVVHDKMHDSIRDLSAFCIERFGEILREQGLITKEGVIVDASFVEVPRQRNTREENALVKNGETPEAWKDSPEKLRQKDLDARWTKKNGVSYFGYKDHVKADAVFTVIEDYEVTAANVHDSQVLFDLVDDTSKGVDLFADSAYGGEAFSVQLEDLKGENYIHEKAHKNRPLSEGQKTINKLKSSIRCRVEHIFGHIENSMGGPELRYIGLKRNAAGIGLCNLAYNMKRYVQLIRLGIVETA